MNAIGARLSSVAIAIATAVVIVAVAIVPFLTPAWVGFEQDRAQAMAWTGFTAEGLRTATDAILGDLVLGGDFAVAVDGRPVLNDRERSHMGDVRTVFRGLWILAAVSVVVLAVAALRSDRHRMWTMVRRGALGLTVGVVIIGVVAAVAFDQLFEAFHVLFFPAGTYLFDPSTDRLVQLFPFQFWDETSMAVGGVIVVMAVTVAFAAGRRTATSPDDQPARDRAVALESGS